MAPPVARDPASESCPTAPETGHWPKPDPRFRDPKMALPASADRGVLRTGSRAIQLARSAAGKMAGSRRPSPSVSANRARSRDDGEDWRRGLCRAAGVAVVEAADQGQRDDAAVIGWLDGSRLGRVLVEGEVRARGMVVTEITAQTPTEVSLVEDNDVVEYVAADGANHALDEGVLPRRAGRGENLGDADPFHASPELVAVDAIAIAQDVARCRVIGNASTICCAVHAAVGESVTLKCTTLRRSCTRTTNT